MSSIPHESAENNEDSLPPEPSVFDFTKLYQNIDTFGLQDVSGGYSIAKRGLAIANNGERVFVKLGVDDLTKSWVQKDFETYEMLRQLAYDFIPKFSYTDGSALILPDLSTYDWSPHWTSQKLQAALGAQEALTDIDPVGIRYQHSYTSVLRGCWDDLSDASTWQKIVNAVNGDDQKGIIGAVSANERGLLSKESYRVDFNRGEFIHGDVRSDNIAYDESTDKLILVDWNWAEIASADLGRTAFLLSVLNESVLSGEPDLNMDDIEKLIDPQAARMLAGYFLQQSQLPPFKPGDPDGLRSKQLNAGVTALKYR